MSTGSLSFAGAHHACTIEAGVATLTITNARKLNIVSTPVIRDLVAAITSLRDRADVRVLVMRGQGDAAFIGGADINEMATLEPASAERFIAGLRSLCDAVRFFPAPVIARLAGWTLGGGLEVAMACDLRIAAADAHFGMPEVRIGIPSVIHAALLNRLIGQSRAQWLLLTGRDIDAQRAESWGLVHQVCPLSELDAVVTELAASLASFGPAALAQQKRLMRAWEDTPLDAAIEATVTEFGRSFTTGEPQHFMGAFLAAKAAKAGKPR